MPDVLLERDSSGFTVRVETEERVHVMTDGGKHASVEEFLAAPDTRLWLSDLGHTGTLALTLETNEANPPKDLR